MPRTISKTFKDVTLRDILSATLLQDENGDPRWEISYQVAEDAVDGEVRNGTFSFPLPAGAIRNAIVNHFQNNVLPAINAQADDELFS